MPEYLRSLAPTLIAGLVSIAVVYITQYKTKKLTFFQTYFTKKVDAYSSFWAAEARYEQEPTQENHLLFLEALHTVTLFTPEEAYNMIMSFSSALIDGTLKTCDVGIDDVVDIMRKDLEQCKKLKFD